MAVGATADQLKPFLGRLGIAPELFDEVVSIRRKFHRLPELAFQETRTAATIRTFLGGIVGIDVLEAPAGGTGVLAVIEGGEPGRTICFRADMDALPITEASMAGPTTEPTIAADCCVMCGRNAPPWQQGNGTGKHEAPAPAAAVEKPAWSSVDGVSHACGHDGHMAMLLIAGRMIAERRRTLHGKVVLLFQPAEERHPINNPMGGAIRMIRDQAAGAELARRLGVPVRAPSAFTSAATEKQRNETDGHDQTMDSSLLDGVDEIYGIHLWNYASAGTVGCAGGAVTANSDSLALTVCGTGGHASAPQGTVDPIVVSAQLISTLQTIVSRNVSPTESAVITLGKIEGGFAPNVIATSVSILGTMRTFTPPVKALLVRRIREVAAGVAVANGSRCSIEVMVKDGYPACVNDPDCAAAVLGAASGLLDARLVGPPTPNMAGEDFTFFLSRKPGAMFFIGSNPQAPCALDPSVPIEAEELEHGDRRVIAHHTPEFDIHEGSLGVGVAMWVRLAEERLRGV